MLTKGIKMNKKIIFFTFTAIKTIMPLVLFAKNSPVISIKGKLNTVMYGVSQKQKSGKARGVHTSVENSEIIFTVENTSETGLKSAAYFSLIGTPYMSRGPNPTVFKKVYGELSGPAGTLRIGNTDSVTRDFIYDGSEYLPGFGGYSAGLKNVFNDASKANMGLHPTGDTNKATKIVYISPYFSLHPTRHQVMFAVNFCPNSEHLGSSPMVDNRSQSFATQGSIFGERVTEYVVRYEDKVGDWETTLAAGGVYGKSRDGRNTIHLGNNQSGTAAKHNLHNYNAQKVGVSIAYKDTSASAGYVRNGKSAIQKTGVSLDPNNWHYEQYSRGKAGNLMNIGVRQKFGPASVGIGGQFNQNRINSKDRVTHGAVSLEGSYQVMEGAKVIAGVTYIKQNTNPQAVLLTQFEGATNVDPVDYDQQVIDDNKGFVIGGGFNLKF